MLNIGLTPCFMYKDPSRIVFGHKDLTYMENEMVKYVAGDNNLPFLIPFLEEPLLYKFLDNCDGIILQGGSDLSPKSYGQDFLDMQKWPGDHFRDIYEFKILDYCFKKKIPIFGICRGLQVINTYLKGTLHQDLKLKTNTTVIHRCAEKYDHIHHEVILEESLLKKVYQNDKIMVNSVHHQGIEKLGRGLVKEAYCPQDNLIEAFSHENMEDHYILAVQWHPEFSHTLGNKVTSPQPLIEHFYHASNKYRLNKGIK
jgi:putative glutamine amidotransferase